MVRRQTWILLVIFIVLLGVVFYLQKKPLPVSSTDITPSPTASISLLAGFQAQDIVFVSLKDSLGNTVQLSNNGGNWVVLPENKPVDTGKAEEIRAQLADITVMSVLPASFSKESGGLSSPSRTLMVKNTQGKQIEVRIGKETPTGSGYYVQIDNNTPVVVEKGSIDTLLGQLTVANLAPTLTPAVPTAVKTTPSATPTP